MDEFLHEPCPLAHVRTARRCPLRKLGALVGYPFLPQTACGSDIPDLIVPCRDRSTFRQPGSPPTALISQSSNAGGSGRSLRSIRSIDSECSAGIPRSTSTCSLSIRPGASSVCSVGGVCLFRGAMPFQRFSFALSIACALATRRLNGTSGSRSGSKSADRGSSRRRPIR